MNAQSTSLDYIHRQKNAPDNDKQLPVEVDSGESSLEVNSEDDILRLFQDSYDNFVPHLKKLEYNLRLLRSSRQVEISNPTVRLAAIQENVAAQVKLNKDTLDFFKQAYEYFERLIQLSKEVSHDDRDEKNTDDESIPVLTQRANDIQRSLWVSKQAAVSGIFSKKTAEVNAPGDLGNTIEPVQNFQRRHGLTASEADEIYRSVIDSVRNDVLEDITSSANEPYDEGYLISSIGEETIEAAFLRAGKIVHKIEEIESFMKNVSTLNGPVVTVKLDYSAFGSNHEVSSSMVDLRAINKLRHDASILNKQMIKPIDKVVVEATKQGVMELSEDIRKIVEVDIETTYQDILMKNLGQFNRLLDEVMLQRRPSASYSLEKQVDYRSSNAPQRTSYASTEYIQSQYSDKPIVLRGELLPWIDEDREISIAYADSGRKVGLIDGRTKNSLDIENRSFDGKKSDIHGEMIDSLQRRLYVAVNRAAEGVFETMPAVHSVDKTKYPYVIRGAKVNGPNALRSYYSFLPIDQVAQVEPVGELTNMGVEGIVIWLGACTKAHQEDMLHEFMNLSRRRLRSLGVGSI